MGAANTATSKQSLTDHAYGRIRQAIICWDMEPGEQVTELQLTSRFELSRAAVRAALARLAYDGLVRPIPGRGSWSPRSPCSMCRISSGCG